MVFEHDLEPEDNSYDGVDPRLRNGGTIHETRQVFDAFTMELRHDEAMTNPDLAAQLGPAVALLRFNLANVDDVCSDRDTARKLGVTERTVRNYRSRTLACSKRNKADCYRRAFSSDGVTGHNPRPLTIHHQCPRD